MLDSVDPRLVRVAREARSRYRHLYVMRLPLARPFRRRAGWRKEGKKKTAVFEVFNEWDFLFRALTATEFDQFSYEAQFSDITEDIVRTALLYPISKSWRKNPIQKVMPGHFEAMRDQIIDISGFGSQQALEQGISYGREQANTLYGAIQAFVCRAFPGKTPLEIADMPWLDQVKLIGAAEMITGQEFPLKDLLEGGEDQAAKPPRDFSSLPTYTPEELDAMRSDSARKAMVDQIHARRREMMGIEPDERRRKRVDQVAQKRMEQERREGRA